jgi:dTMP kinase
MLVHGDLQPDLTLLLDLPVELGLKRAARRSQADRFEQESTLFFERVRAAYLERAQAAPGRFAVIDAAGTMEQVWSHIDAVLRDRMGS